MYFEKDALMQTLYRLSETLDRVVKPFAEAIHQKEYREAIEAIGRQMVTLGGLSPDHIEDVSLRSLYNSFAQARAQVGQAAKTPGYERFRDQIRSQLQTLKKQGKTGPVEFRVSIQDRKVSLKARPSR